MIPELIYDVGMHNGDDTAYYLHRGFRVIAVEASALWNKSPEHSFWADLHARRGGQEGAT